MKLMRDARFAFLSALLTFSLLGGCGTAHTPDSGHPSTSETQDALRARVNGLDVYLFGVSKQSEPGFWCWYYEEAKARTNPRTAQRQADPLTTWSLHHRFMDSHFRNLGLQHLAEFAFAAKSTAAICGTAATGIGALFTGAFCVLSIYGVGDTAWRAGANAKAAATYNNARSNNARVVEAPFERIGRIKKAVQLNTSNAMGAKCPMPSSFIR